MIDATSVSRKLYMFYVGGNAGQSNIEVHDVQFAAISRVEDAYSKLRRNWFGDPDKLHLDGYMQICWADGFDIKIADEPCASGQKLFFVNMGGYEAGKLAEIHDFALFVAPNSSIAKAKARHSLLRGADMPHKDNLKDVDNCLALTTLDDAHVNLEANPFGKPDHPEWQGYRSIGVQSAPL